jgi:hydroxypyruvate reductase
VTGQRRHLRADALRIWQAGVDAVRADRLVQGAFRVEGPTLWIGDEPIALDAVRRIAVVGAGKAGAGMAAAVEEALGPEIARRKQLNGWVNVPDNTIRRLEHIHLHGARPAGINEPTAAGVEGARQIVRLVESLGPHDLCLALVSGGGSALLPAPVAAITLDDKLAVTRHLSAAGATIVELNVVRKQLSQIKGGGLARACCAGRLVALIISDVLGDPLDVISSGPTVEDTATPQQALEVLARFRAREAGVSPRVFDYLESRQAQARGMPPIACQVTNLIIGNNASAVDAAGEEAVRLGYSPAMVSATASEGPAEDLGRHLAAMGLAMRAEGGPDCLISGGEPVVELVASERRGLGGRNQQLVLAAVESLWDDGGADLAILSGGTDGEDGPTDAAGAAADAAVIAAARQLGLDPSDYLARNDAYRFFEPLGALIKTGPTHTNVCDIRVVVTRPT